MGAPTKPLEGKERLKHPHLAGQVDGRQLRLTGEGKLRQTAMEVKLLSCSCYEIKYEIKAAE